LRIIILMNSMLVDMKPRRYIKQWTKQRKLCAVTRGSSLDCLRGVWYCLCWVIAACVLLPAKPLCSCAVVGTKQSPRGRLAKTKCGVVWRFASVLGRSRAPARTWRSPSAGPLLPRLQASDASGGPDGWATPPLT
jgi:hypothetical protein